MLAGRESEILMILGELQSVGTRGSAGSVLIRGPGGIGKSSLLDALAQRPELSDGAMIAGRADSFDRGIPLGAIRDAIGSYQNVGMSTETRAVLAELRTTLDIRRLGEAAAAHPIRRPDLIVGLLTDLLTRLARQRPVLFALDDLHLADAESVALYQLLTRQLAQLPVLFVLTARPGHKNLAALEAHLTRLQGTGRAMVVDLEPLPTSAIEQLVASIVDHPPAIELTDHISSQSAGNPFFVRELTLQLVAERSVQVRHGRARLNPTAERLQSLPSRSLTRRFFPANSDESRTASALSIFGRFQLWQLPMIGDLTNLTPDRVTACCELLIASQLLIRTTDGYEFAHPLLKSSLYGDLGHAQRSVMHAMIADRLQAQQAAGVAIDVFELATHVAASDRPGDDRALEILLAAARLAMQDAPLVAAQWFASALEVMPRSHPLRPSVHAEHTYAYLIAAHSKQAVTTGRAALAEPANGLDRTGLVFATVHALYSNGQLDEAVELISRHHLAGREDQPLVALQMSMLTQLGRIPEATELYHRARTHQVPAHPMMAHPMTAHPSATEPIATEPIATDPSAGDPMTSDSSAADPITAATALVHLLLFAQMTGRNADSREFDSRIRQLLPDIPTSIRVEFLHLLALTPVAQSGSTAQSEADLATARALRGGVTTVSAGGNAENAALTVDWLRGRWDRAMLPVMDAIELMDSSGNVLTVSALRGYSALILTDRGDYRAALDLLGEQHAELTSALPLLTVSRARAARHLGNPSGAIELLAQFCAQAAQRGLLSYYSLAAEEWATGELELGNRTRADEIAAETVDLVLPVGSPLLDLVALRTVAAITGDLDAGRRSVAIAEAEGLPVELAKSLLVLHESPGGRAEGLLRAHGIFAEVRAVPWLRRTNQALRRLGRAAPRQSDGSELTATELELISLVVQGKSNRQIAADLKYSPKTVEVYLSRLYAKTGYPSRVDLARAALQGAFGAMEQR